MDNIQQNEIIKREFRKRNGRGTVQLLYDIQEIFTHPSGWKPKIEWIMFRAEQIGVKVRWDTGRH